MVTQPDDTAYIQALINQATSGQVIRLPPRPAPGDAEGVPLPR